ncbi:hypothetical protein UFOVP153_18 [uncultured Caudovirales phage]|uniref:Uncharacterized protein n=1 Tax=uncultured Caudovirales phage TaxID=2100421 RepID=A0A6J7W9K4_9CAUD|nr:hypothetical protein UFOVP69_40 [uncultured Caudovirales phage]CAB5170396.1 hypothetical protein UFOVP153_18 [uncultured Caudovirales phage]
MAIIATNSGSSRELIPANNYLARCYQMIEIGTVKESILGKEVIAHKVRIGWELPTELKVFNPEKGEQPCVISKEYTLSMNEKANLRKMLASWRSADFTEEQAKAFDITKLLGVPCMINIIHKPSKDGSKVYEEIAGVTAVPKGITVPVQITPTFCLSYDQFDGNAFNSLPDFIKNKMMTSLEYAKIADPNSTHFDNPNTNEVEDDLPF